MGMPNFKNVIQWAFILWVAAAASFVTGQTVVQRFPFLVVDNTVKTGNGTSSDPAYSFSSNKFDGLYRVSTGHMAFATNGSNGLSIGSSMTVRGDVGGFLFASTNNPVTSTAANTRDAGIRRLQAGIVQFVGGDITAGGTFKIGDPGVRPVCTVTLRGTFWLDEGGASVQDSVAVCAKDGSDVYDWRTIY